MVKTFLEVRLSFFFGLERTRTSPFDVYALRYYVRFPILSQDHAFRNRFARRRSIFFAVLG